MSQLTIKRDAPGIYHVVDANGDHWTITDTEEGANRWEIRHDRSKRVAFRASLALAKQAIPHYAAILQQLAANRKQARAVRKAQRKQATINRRDPATRPTDASIIVFEQYLRRHGPDAPINWGGHSKLYQGCARRLLKEGHPVVQVHRFACEFEQAMRRQAKQKGLPGRRIARKIRELEQEAV